MLTYHNMYDSISLKVEFTQQAKKGGTPGGKI